MKNYEWIDARLLLTVERLDLMAKYLFVEAYLTNEGIEWATELYKKHIEAFSGGSFREPGNKEKSSIDSYIEVFKQLIVDIKNDGFNPDDSVIPVSLNRVILDGAHRTAICAFLGMKVACSISERNSVYNYDFFGTMHLEQKYIDAMVTKYVEVCGKKCYVVCVWPKACRSKVNLERIDELINQYTNKKVLCKKDIDITYNGLLNFMIQIYGRYGWAGNPDNNFKGIEGKVDPCYDSCNKLRTYIVELDTVDEMIQLKKTIRDCVGLENHSVHSSDNFDETLLMTHILYNENSLNLLNYGNISYDSNLVNRIIGFKNWQLLNNLDSKKMIVDSSSIMGLYGIRKVGDVDYLSIDSKIDIKNTEYDDHADYADYYPTDIDNLILNPSLYCYAFDVKFITLNVLKSFKKSRAQKKDLDDIVLIEDKLKSVKSIKRTVNAFVIKLTIALRNYKTRFRNKLEDHNVYVFTKILHFVRGKGFK